MKCCKCKKDLEEEGIRTVDYVKDKVTGTVSYQQAIVCMECSKKLQKTKWVINRWFMGQGKK